MPPAVEPEPESDGGDEDRDSADGATSMIAPRLMLVAGEDPGAGFVAAPGARVAESVVVELGFEVVVEAVVVVDVELVVVDVESNT